ncbi:MAG: helicase [Sulfurimonas sp.]|nr:helicase [Sulfurimonas sp.]
MSKKNKKNSKTNQQIKKYFDGDPFDVGIQRVTSETLSELFHYLGIYEIEHSRDLLIKTIRMIWSEADNVYRKQIVEFFANEGVVYPSDKAKEPSITSLDKLDEILQEFDITTQESAIIYAEFGDKRAKKITPTKIESKIKHIRFEVKKTALEKQLEGFFDIDDSFEFNANIHYILYEQSFYKIHTLNTPVYSYEYLDENEFDDIVSKIEADKKNTQKKYQENINKFIQNIPNPHSLLNEKEIVSSLRASPPKSHSKYPLIKEEILSSIISKYLPLVSLELHSEELLVQVEQTIKLPNSEDNFKYKLDLHIELSSLLKDIWNDEELDFSLVINEAKQEHEKQFLKELSNIVDECKTYAIQLNLSQEVLYQKIYKLLLDMVPSTLIISPKITRKTVRKFIYSIQEEVLKFQRQALLAQTIRDFKNLFPLAREMRRKLTLHIGPTNSGKTYEAIQKLQTADTGYYLAPLRLLALEGYEGLRENKIDASLITGEEQILDEEATHISSTIEMLNFDVDVDVCVIDEVQMIDDIDRGWAWANAIIGAPAKELIMTGSPNSKDAIIALAEYLGEELEIIEFERKNPLILLDTPTSVQNVKKGSAIIAFSRKDVLKLKQNFSKNFSVSVVYGNLSPEVRREEARRFRSGETEILIATDAIAMGLNLPIETILFSKAEKFDGISQRNLIPSEIHQISGRAGRFGLNEEGFVGALNADVLKIIQKNFYKEDKEIVIPFNVMANLGHIKLVSSILQEHSLYEVLRFFVKNMVFNGPFVASNLEDMLEVAKIVDEYDLDITTKYHLSCAPLTLKSPHIISAFNSYALSLEQKEIIPYVVTPLAGKHAITTQDLLKAEDMVKEISLYLWLSYRFKDYFLDKDKATKQRNIINKYIENSLHQPSFVQTCRLCSTPLPHNSKHNICNRCFRKNYTGHGHSHRGRR